MILRDATCSACGREAEVLGEEVCPCGGAMVPHAISFHPTQVLDVAQDTIRMKASQIRKRLQGRLPWRRSSESQSD
jgi:hypothetical protein